MAYWSGGTRTNLIGMQLFSTTNYRGLTWSRLIIMGWAESKREREIEREREREIERERGGGEVGFDLQKVCR